MLETTIRDFDLGFSGEGHPGDDLQGRIEME